MPTPDYTAPVSKLLEVGEPEWSNNQAESWLDYPEKYGLSAADIPQLIKMASDKALENSPDDTLAFAPVHAWRALGQLKAEAAIEPLVKLLDTEDDYAAQDIPQVFGLIGAKALPALAEYLSKHVMGEDSLAGMNAADAIVKIGQNFPEAAEKAGALLIQQLERYKDNAADLNGALVAGLTELKAKNALPLIEQAFEADKVDIMHADLDSVRFGFGLIDEAEYKKREEVNNAKRRELQQQIFGSPPRQMLQNGAAPGEAKPKSGAGGNKVSPAKKEKAKAKRKMEKTSRKINRKKK